MPLPAGGLRGIFDDAEVVSLGEREDIAHRRGFPIEMDGDDGAGAGGDAPLGIGRVHVKAVGKGIHEDRSGAHVANAGGGRGIGEGGNEHFVAGADAEGHERKGERVGAGGEADGVVHAQIGGHLGFEGLDVGAEDEGAAGKHFPQGHE